MNACSSASPMSILLVDDEEQILFSSELILKSKGYAKVICLSDSSRVLPTLESENPHIPVIVVTAVYEIESAVECMKSGAFDYLTKPVRTEDFLACIRRALQLSTLQRENISLKNSLLSDTIDHEEMFAEIRTINRAMRSIFQYMEAVAGVTDPVLITGETGVGKELIASAIHKLSGRTGNLVSVNAAGLDDTIFSDTIFGHKKGAYTGADCEREGLISRAAGGTLFLDEIGDLDAKSQVKLLRLLQEREYYPLGSDIPKKTDARVIVATNRDIEQMAAQDSFRKDLYYRLSPHHIHIPPLRDRADDLPLLVDHFLEKAAADAGKKKPTYPRELIVLLSAYDFPGNIRELEGMVNDAFVRHKGGMLSQESFISYLDKRRSFLSPAFNTTNHAAASPIPNRLPTFSEAEENLVAEALKQAGGTQGVAAKILGITRQALNKRLHKSSTKKG